MCLDLIVTNFNCVKQRFVLPPFVAEIQNYFFKISHGQQKECNVINTIKKESDVKPIQELVK